MDRIEALPQRGFDRTTKRYWWDIRMLSLIRPGSQRVNTCWSDLRPDGSGIGPFDAILAHNVVHHVYADGNLFVFNALEPGQIDDSVVLGVIARLRGGGLNAFVLPQAPDLPMANRREDILITGRFPWKRG